MGLSDRKLETAIVGFSIVMIAGMGYLLKSPVQSALGGQDVVYEMPRPKKSFFASLFDLGDREVSRKYVNPFAKKKADEKKAADAKKAAAAAVAAKPALKPALTKIAQAPAKPKVNVKIVGADSEKKSWGDDAFFAGSGGGQNSNDAATGGNTESENPDAEKGLSGDQWYARIMAEPTAENVSKLVTAFAKQEIEPEAFYRIVEGLYSSNKAETQALGLLAVKSIYTTKSFSVTAQYYDQMTPELKDQADKYFMTYAVSSRLSILAAVLKSNNAEAVAMASHWVVEGYKAAKNGTAPSSDPRNSRGDVITNSVSGYAQFVPIFQQLATNPDATIAGLANSALGQIQISVAAL